MKKYILCAFLIGNIVACGQRSDTNKGDENLELPIESANPAGPDEELQVRIEQSKSVLEKQLREGANLYNEEGYDIPKAAFQAEELNALIVEANGFLWDNGYRDIEDTFFRKKIKEVFGMDVNASDETPVYVSLLGDNCENKPYYHRNNGIDYNGFFVVNNGNFITDFYYLPELIDYASLYPDIAEIEKQMPKSTWNSIHKLEIEIEKWSDLAQRDDQYSLDERREFNRLLVLNRNRYLFQNDKNRLDWLMEHDAFFMERLVKQFGWTADEDLLYAIIIQTRFKESNPDDFGKLFWKKNCNGSVTIHANTFRLLQTLYAPGAASEVNWLLADIQQYLEYMMGYMRYQPQVSVTEAQRVEILANVVYFAEQYKYGMTADDRQGSYHRMMGRFRLMLDETDRKILKENHYFNLPKFKEWWDAADYDEYYVDGEYNGPWGRDNEPMTETEWRENIE